MAAVVDQNDRHVFKGDVDRTIRLLTGLDLTAYAIGDLTIRCRRPDNTFVTLTGTLIENASSGIVVAKFATGDLSLVGNYIVQVKAVKASNPNQASDFMDFWVDDRMSGL